MEKKLLKIRKIIKEAVLKILEETTFYDDGKKIPQGIKNWVKSTLGSDVTKYKIHQGESEVVINLPWHESDYETYQFFKLENNNANPVGNEITRSGNEHNSPQSFLDGQKKDGKVNVPEGYVLVCCGTYPKRAEIYTGNEVQLFLGDANAVSELTPIESIILATTRGLKSAYRPKFADEHYARLIEKGYLKSNRAITTAGLNIVLDPAFKEKFDQAKQSYEKQTGRYLGYSLYI